MTRISSLLFSLSVILLAQSTESKLSKLNNKEEDRSTGTETETPKSEDTSIPLGGNGNQPEVISIHDLEPQADLSNMTPRQKKRYLKLNRRDKSHFPRVQSEIRWEEFEQFHDAGNFTEQFPIFQLTQKYYFDRTKNLTKFAFIDACREYLMEDLSHVDEELTFATIHRIQTIIRRILRHQLFMMHEQTLSFQDFFRYTVGGQLARTIHYSQKFKSLPVEF